MKRLLQPLSMRKKLLSLVLATSGIATAIMVAIQFYEEYHYEKSLLDKIEHSVRSTFSSSLAASLWKLDSNQLKIQLEGILAIKDVVAVEILDHRHQLVRSMQKDSITGVDIFTRLIDLHQLENKERSYVGTLKLHLTEDFILRRLQDKMFSLVLMQAVKTMMVSVILLFLFSYYFTNHIKLISNYFKDEFSPDSQKDPLKLNREGKNRDEMDDLVDNINDHLKQSYTAIHQLTIDKDHIEVASFNQQKSMYHLFHEIRNDLNTLICSIEELEETDLNHEQRSVHAIQQKASQHLKDLVNYYLDDSHSDFGKIKITEFDLGTFITESQLIFSYRCHAVGKTFVTEVSQNSARIKTDKGRLHQVMTNLFTNALKYGGDEIKISAKELENDEIQISIADNGEGIPKQQQENLFLPFNQADLRKNSGIEGSGLGMSIVAELLDHLGGRIDVISDVGSGTQFSIILPREYQFKKEMEEKSA